MFGLDLSESGGVATTVVRGLADAGVLLSFGSLLLARGIAAPALSGWPAEAATSARMLRGLARVGAAGAILASAAWLLLVTANLAEAESLGALLDAVPLVVTGTVFGRLLCLTLPCLLLVALLPRRGALAAATVATVLQALHGHAYGMGDRPLIAVEILHLLAAGAWLGALPGLLLLAARLPPTPLGAVARRFSPLGIASVLVLAATATWQGIVLIGGFHALLTSGYGRVGLAKLAIFLALLGLATLNRCWLTPRLRPQAEATRRALLASIALETMLGLLILLAAALLASLPPPASMPGMAM